MQDYDNPYSVELDELFKSSANYLQENGLDIAAENLPRRMELEFNRLYFMEIVWDINNRPEIVRPFVINDIEFHGYKLFRELYKDIMNRHCMVPENESKIW